MSGRFTIWDNLLHMNRQLTVSNAIRTPITSDNVYKNAIFQSAASNYAQAARPYGNKEWGSLKIKLSKKNSLNDTRPWPVVESKPEYFNYDFYAPGTKGQSENIWVSFANKYVGGGYLTGGWVQEEIITAEFYEMADGINQYTTLGIREMKIDETFLWFNLLQGSEVVPSSYGRLRIPPNTVFNATNFIRPSTRPRMADFISIDAPKRLDVNALYTLPELQQLSVKALVGFESAVFFGRTVIHTGNWGAGDFRNDVQLVYLIQLLAAKLSGVNRIYFWGDKDIKDHKKIDVINNKINSFPDYTARQVFEQVKSLFQITFSFDDIFAPILQNSNSNSNSNQMTTPIVQNPNQRSQIITPLSQPKWAWLAGKEWVLYHDVTQNFLSENLTDTSKMVRLLINNKEYIIAYDPTKGWQQLNVTTGRYRPVNIIRQ